MFTVIGNKTKILCHSAWDIFNAVLKLTDDIMEAKRSWTGVGRLKAGEVFNAGSYRIIRQ